MNGFNIEKLSFSATLFNFLLYSFNSVRLIFFPFTLKGACWETLRKLSFSKILHEYKISYKKLATAKYFVSKESKNFLIQFKDIWWTSPWKNSCTSLEYNKDEYSVPISLISFLIAFKRFLISVKAKIKK